MVAIQIKNCLCSKLFIHQCFKVIFIHLKWAVSYDYYHLKWTVSFILRQLRQYQTRCGGQPTSSTRLTTVCEDDTPCVVVLLLRYLRQVILKLGYCETVVNTWVPALNKNLEKNREVGMIYSYMWSNKMPNDNKMDGFFLDNIDLEGSVSTGTWFMPNMMYMLLLWLLLSWPWRMTLNLICHHGTCISLFRNTCMQNTKSLSVIVWKLLIGCVKFVKFDLIDFWPWRMTLTLTSHPLKICIFIRYMCKPNMKSLPVNGTKVMTLC